MKKTKKLLSLLTALAMTASAFTALAVPANATTAYDLSAKMEGLTTRVISPALGLDKEPKPADANNVGADDIAKCHVPDFGTATSYSEAIPQLDGWGYMHACYTKISDNTTRQTNAGVTVDSDSKSIYLGAVGNDGCKGALSFIPKNVDGLTIPTTGKQVYKFDLHIEVTGGSNDGQFLLGFTGSNDGSTVDSVGNTTFDAIVGAPKDLKMYMVNDFDAKTYAIYSDGIRVANGTVDEAKPITGIYTQSNSARAYAQSKISNFTLTLDEEPIAAHKVTFASSATPDKPIKEYESVLAGTKLTAPDAPTVAGKTFDHWENAAQEKVTEFVAGSEDTTFTAVYREGSLISTVNVKANAFAKVTLTAGDKTYSGYTDATGVAQKAVNNADGKFDHYESLFKDLPNDIDYTYKIEKKGYTPKEGTFKLPTTTDYNLEETLTLDEDHKDYSFYEADWTDGKGEFTNGDGGRTSSTNISAAPVDLPANEDSTIKPFQVTVNIGMNAYGTDVASQATWTLKNDKGVLLGIQWQKGTGIYALTGWDGSKDQNGSGDVGKGTNKVMISDVDKTGDMTVDFIVDLNKKQVSVLMDDAALGTMPIPDDMAAGTQLVSMTCGQYRYHQAISVKELSVKAPDPTWMVVSGDTEFAKVSGHIIEKQYSKAETTETEDGFTWTITGAGTTGVEIDNNGLLKVSDNAVAGKYTITATGNTTGKNASLEITIDDFQQLTLNADGPQAYDKTDATGEYKMLSAVDTLGTDITELVTPVWSIDNTDVAEINAETGALKVKAYGKTKVTLTVTNGTAVSTAEIPVTVGKFSIVKDAAGDTTAVDFSEIEKADEYLVTTSKDGVIVNQFTTTGETTTVKAAEAGKKITATYDKGALVSAVVADLAEGEVIPAATETTKVMAWKSLESMEPVKTTTEVKTALDVDTKGADKVEVGGIYKTKVTGNAATGYSVGDTIAIPAGTYKFEITNAGGDRGDIYVNEQMLVNNMLQNGATVNSYTANDIVVSQGYATMKTYDDKGINADVTITKLPSSAKRVPKMFVLGDSLVCIYYNGGSPENNLQQTGWGQVLQDYITDDVEVVDLGNSGVTAPGLYGSAFTQIQQSAQEGDYLVLESGYNDSTYETEDKMKTAVRNMVDESLAKDMKVVIVSPNASHHDYKASVHWTGYMKDVADEYMGEGDKHNDNVGYIDLSAISYKFLFDKYGDAYATGGELNDLSKIYNVSDRLHSTYNAANCWAAIIAQNIKTIWGDSMVKADHTYKFTDGKNEEITVGVGLMPTLEAAE